MIMLMALQPSTIKAVNFPFMNNLMESVSVSCAISVGYPKMFNKYCVCSATVLVIGAQVKTPVSLCVLFKYKEYPKNNSK